jgi:hypothetical protein
MIDQEFGMNMIERTPVESPYQKVRELTGPERKEMIALVQELRHSHDAGYLFHLAAAINLAAKRKVKHSVAGKR